MHDSVVDYTRLLPRKTFPSVFGFDYGIPVHMVLAIDTSFVNLLSRSEIVGCAYGYDDRQGFDTPVRVLSLLARHAEPARQAFQLFAEWANVVDADIVDVRIALIKEGGYVLSIGPETTRTSVRLCGYGLLYDPIFMAATYLKRMDTVSAGLRDLQKYKRLDISPVLFTAAHSAASIPTSVTSLSPIRDCPDLLKYNLTILDEEESKQNPLVQEFLAGPEGSNPSFPSMPAQRREYTPAGLSSRRQQFLKDLFPVTLFRISGNSALLALKEDFIKKGVRGWQVDQAICNLQVSEGIRRRLLYNPDGNPIPLNELSSRFEDMRTPLVPISRVQLEAQLLADAHYLLNAVEPNLEIALTFYESAGQLAHLGYLDG